jgi:hypothetical protein
MSPKIVETKVGRNHRPSSVGRNYYLWPDPARTVRQANVTLSCHSGPSRSFVFRTCEERLRRTSLPLRPLTFIKTFEVLITATFILRFSITFFQRATIRRYSTEPLKGSKLLRRKTTAFTMLLIRVKFLISFLDCTVSFMWFELHAHGYQIAHLRVVLW